jgi:hypothetical protein
MQVEILPPAPLPDSVKVARRFVKPLVLVRIQVWQPISNADGWQSSNAPVPKTERASGLRGCNPYTIRQFSINHYETHTPLPKPAALSHELQTKPCHPNPLHKAEIHFSPRAVRSETTNQNL